MFSCHTPAHTHILSRIGRHFSNPTRCYESYMVNMWFTRHISETNTSFCSFPSHQKTNWRDIRFLQQNEHTDTQKHTRRNICIALLGRMNRLIDIFSWAFFSFLSLNRLLIRFIYHLKATRHSAVFARISFMNSIFLFIFIPFFFVLLPSFIHDHVIFSFTLLAFHFEFSFHLILLYFPVVFCFVSKWNRPRCSLLASNVKNECEKNQWAEEIVCVYNLHTRRARTHTQIGLMKSAFDYFKKKMAVKRAKNSVRDKWKELMRNKLINHIPLRLYLMSQKPSQNVK